MAFIMTDSSEPGEEQSPPSMKRYQLPKATNFDEVNENFDSLSDFVTLMIDEMKNNAEITSENLTKLAKETSENLGNLAADIKSILSSQTMMFTICIILVCFTVLTVKSIYEFISHFALFG